MRLAMILLCLFMGVKVFAASPDTLALMRLAEQNLSKSPLLEAKFQQKTTMPFIDVALESDGKFCFDIRNREKPLIFWEYQTPDVSGFFLKDGKASFWTAKEGKELSESEMKALKGMTDQIFQWISFDPQKLLKIYTASKTGPRTLRFEPLGKSRLFSAIEFTLTEDFQKLESLAFHGQNGEITNLLFNVETLNQPLSDACRK